MARGDRGTGNATPSVAIVDPAAAERSRALAEAAEEAEANPRDETVPGGRYLVNGMLVDADGVLVNETKASKAADLDKGDPVPPADLVTGTEPPPEPED